VSLNQPLWNYRWQESSAGPTFEACESIGALIQLRPQSRGVLWKWNNKVSSGLTSFPAATIVKVPIFAKSTWRFTSRTKMLPPSWMRRLDAR